MGILTWMNATSKCKFTESFRKSIPIDVEIQFLSWSAVNLVLYFDCHLQNNSAENICKAISFCDFYSVNIAVLFVVMCFYCDKDTKNAPIYQIYSYILFLSESHERALTSDVYKHYPSFYGHLSLSSKGLQAQLSEIISESFYSEKFGTLDTIPYLCTK